MAFPIRVCSLCGEEFELKPDKPGFANRCPACSLGDEDRGPGPQPVNDVLGRDREANAARRKAMRDMLYRKES